MDDMELRQAFGRRLRHRRVELAMTQEKLAEAADISTSFIGCLERAEKVPSMETVVRLAEALDITLDALVLGKRGVRCEREKCPLYEELLALLRAWQ